jgi:hypothetical protein
MKYKKRFQDIIKRFTEKDKSVLDICFGDTIIADECKRRNIIWMGYDLNSYFVVRAQKNGFNASLADVVEIQSFPKADVCVMCGSLYHFIEEIETVLTKLLDSAPKILISEPVENLSSQKGMIGTISKILTNAGKGKESFRFDKKSLIDVLDVYKIKLHFNYIVISTQRDMLIEITHDRN